MTENLDDKKKEDEKKEEEGQEVNPGADPKKTENSTDIGPIPYDRFKEVNDRAKAAEARIKELEKKEADRQSDAEKARLDRMKEQEKFQELAEEMKEKYEALQPKYEAMEQELQKHQEVLKQFADAQLEAVPELFRDVVGAMPLLERLQWLTDNRDKLTTKGKPGGVPATPEGVNRPDLTDEDRRRRAARTF